MKKTLSYLVFIIVMALSLGILTGCVQKEQNEAKDVIEKEVAGETINNDENEEVNSLDDKDNNKESKKDIEPYQK